jgi:hypothetical protein
VADTALADSPPADGARAADSTAGLDSASAIDSASAVDSATAADGGLADAPSADAAVDVAVDGLTSDGSCVTGGQPPPGYVASLPPPPWCAALPAVPWFDGAPPPPALAVEIGWRDAAGQWHAYQDGDWVPLYVGTQGGFMVMPVTRVLLPGQEAPTVKMQYQAQVLQGCATVASSPGLVTKLVQAPTVEAWYQTDPTVSLYVQYDAPASQIGAACGLWIELLWRYRPADAASWGEKRLRLRTYIASMAPIPPGG